MTLSTNTWARATRAAGLTELDAFRARMGKRYASGRNFDLGPGRHTAVSCLSPYVRRRLVLEEELVAAALDAHGLAGAEKFIQEVFWRGYFKGWLERRPGIWRSYVDGLAKDRLAVDTDPKLAKRLTAAEDGRTGIACFDCWATELTTTGYLHNHARMWFASIWIFTLGLPWRLGADFFYRHLLDGDPASNMLSWRWVGGLHTRGKVYEAKAWNIAKFTKDRFQPTPADLAADVGGLEASEPDGLPEPAPLRSLPRLDDGQPTALLVTEEDTHPESWAFDARTALGVATLRASHLRSPLPVSDRVTHFEAGALQDAATRLGGQGADLEAHDPKAVATWAQGLGATQIVTGYIPEGPLRDWMRDAEGALAHQNITLVELRRDWDTAIWPLATAGFFKVKKKIPAILRDLGFEDRQPRLL
jgi:deoxyribodipyrimidine photo-lyase